MTSVFFGPCVRPCLQVNTWRAKEVQHLSKNTVVKALTMFHSWTFYKLFFKYISIHMKAWLEYNLCQYLLASLEAPDIRYFTCTVKLSHDYSSTVQVNWINLICSSTHAQEAKLWLKYVWCSDAVECVRKRSKCSLRGRSSVSRVTLMVIMSDDSAVTKLGS